jgi:hypothetical protein
VIKVGKGLIWIEYPPQDPRNEQDESPSDVEIEKGETNRLQKGRNSE